MTFINRGGGAANLIIQRVAITAATFTPLVAHTMFTIPGAGVAVGDLHLAYISFVTVAFNGTTPSLSSYIQNTTPGNKLEAIDPTAISADWDFIPGCGMVEVKELLGFAPGTGVGLITAPTSFQVILDNGAGGNPNSTIGAAEYWLLTAKKP